MCRSSLVFLAVWSVSSVCIADELVEIRVDGTRIHQTYEGFGATTLSLVHDGSLGDSLGPKLRAKALDAAYNQVKLTMGNLNVGPLETPRSWNERRNDNDDPRTINWNGFNVAEADRQWKHLVKPAAEMGFDNDSLAGNINWKWSSPWLAELYRKDRDRCLEECAEQVEVCVTYWKKLTGRTPRYVHLFNEPTSGNGEIAGADAQMVRDIVKQAGRRLRTAGFADVKFVVPNEETVAHTFEIAKVILEDTETRSHVAAIGYHVYPYGSPYASVPRILRDSGNGRPDRASIAQRQQLRDLCRHYNVPVWMTEVSHGEVDPRSFDHLRGRAIHIHDEMVYADAAAFYGMNAIWDQKTHASHFAGRGGEDRSAYLSEQDTIVLVDNDAERVLITGMGYAIGHYARWLSRGAIRLEATSDDPLVLVTAFRDNTSKNVVLVVINNAPEERNMRVSFSGVVVRGEMRGEQSRAHARWEPVKSTVVVVDRPIQARAPALSVTTWAVNCTAE
jgi:O-glycosyl hydrolase